MEEKEAQGGKSIVEAGGDEKSSIRLYSSKQPWT